MESNERTATISIIVMVSSVEHWNVTLTRYLAVAARPILLLPRTNSATDRIRTELHWLNIPSGEYDL